MDYKIDKVKIWVDKNIENIKCFVQTTVMIMRAELVRIKNNNVCTVLI
jgi:hypothetical protein